jgi:hypothetical protein
MEQEEAAVLTEVAAISGRLSCPGTLCGKLQPLNLDVDFLHDCGCSETTESVGTFWTQFQKPSNGFSNVADLGVRNLEAASGSRSGFGSQLGVKGVIYGFQESDYGLRSYVLVPGIS